MTDPVSITSLATLRALDMFEALNGLNIYTIADLAAYPPFVHAEAVVTAAATATDPLSIWTMESYLREEPYPPDAAAAGALATGTLKSVDETLATTLADALAVTTLAEAAAFEPYVEAKSLLDSCANAHFCELPSAPRELMPKAIGSTHTAVRLSNYVKDVGYKLTGRKLKFEADDDEPTPREELSALFYRKAFRFHLGYLAGFRQRWRNAGTHLGEVVYSLALAPGESRNIATVDWTSRQTSSRTEDSTSTETLTNTFTQTRALNEVVQATANEHIYGQTDVDATTTSTATGLTGGLGGGNANSAALGAAADVDLSSIVGFPLGVGADGGAANTNSMAGSVGASYVASKGTVQGTLKSETTGERGVTAELQQNIMDATVQNAASVRGIMSTVVVEDVQAGSQAATTRNVTNYNHMHALTVQYFEVLQKYLVATSVDSLTPVLFLPFAPLTFDIDIVRAYWHLISVPIGKALPARIGDFDTVVKEFDPGAGVFDPSGDLKITSVAVDRTRSWSQNLKVRLHNANPVVKFQISGSKLDSSLDLKMKGSRTHLSYEVLSTATKTAAVDIDLGETLTWEVDDSFKAVFKSKLKAAIDDAEVDSVFDAEPDYNKIGATNVRSELKDMVTAGEYTIENGSEGLTLDFDAAYDLKDQNGNATEVAQTCGFDFTYSELHAGLSASGIEINPAIETYLGDVSDINPSAVVDELLAFCEFHKYALTKYILLLTEKEQIIDIVEHLQVDGVLGTDISLTELIDPAPVAMVENLLIFPLKRAVTVSSAVTAEMSTPVSGGGKVRKVSATRSAAAPGLSVAGPAAGTVDPKNPAGVQDKDKDKDKNGGANAVPPFEAPDKSFESFTNIPQLIQNYIDEIEAHLAELKATPARAELFLPTPGVFAEAILGRANSAEYVDATRFYNWQDSPIPNAASAIGEIDLNATRAQSESGNLAPTTVETTLTATAPTAYAMPTSLTEVLGAIQNGAMFTDMSKTADFGSMLDKLATVATTAATQAGTLAGEAGKSALDSAVKLGEKTADLAKAALESQKGSTVPAASTAKTAAPPSTPTEKAAALNELSKIADNPTPATPASPIDAAKAGVMGTSLGSGSTGGGSTGGGFSRSSGSSGSSSSGGGSVTVDDSGVVVTDAPTSFELVIRLFIPSEIVKFDLDKILSYIGEVPAWLTSAIELGVSGLITGLHGDNRDFGYSETAFRAELRAQLSFVDGNYDSPMTRTTSPISGKTRDYHLLYGETTEYDHDLVEAVTGKPWWWAANPNGVAPLYSPTSLELYASNTSFTAERNGSRIDASFGINASLPAQSLILMHTAPQINASLGLTCELNGDQLTVTLRGSHDYFPSYEVYINGEALYQQAADDTLGPLGLLTLGASVPSGLRPQITRTFTI